MSKNRLFVGLIVLALLILGLSTEAWAQQSGKVELGDSVTIKMPAPANLLKGTILTADLAITGEATITLTHIDTEQSASLSKPSDGGSITNWEIDFDSLGLPAGSYRIKEAFSGTVVVTIPFINFGPLYLNVEFEYWETDIPAGAKIVIKFTASGIFSVSGDFTGETGYLDPLPACIWGFPMTLQKDVKVGDIIEFDFSLDGTLTKTTEICYTLGDVSGNGEVTAYDASLVLQYVVGLLDFSVEQQKAADVTGDGNVTALDAALILQYTVELITQFPVLDAPILVAKEENQLLTKIIAELENPFLSKKQKHVLEQLKHLLWQQALLKQTTLLQNFPNPFNPETWIPFKLAADAFVTINIYNQKVQFIRIISLGQKAAGVYLSKGQAAHWDGKDSLGRKISSGVYFYILQAGEFRATRKMVIAK